jgi:hypothetical protein
MHSCWTGWLHVKCWKWPPPSRHVRTWRTLSAVRSRTPCSVLISCQMLSFKASMVQGSFLYTISSKQPQRNKFGDLTSGNQAGHRSFKMILPWSGVIPTVGMNATQHNMLRPWQIIHAWYRHEQAIPEHVPIAFIHLFKNYRVKWPRHSTSITLYQRATGFMGKRNSTLE